MKKLTYLFAASVLLAGTACNGTDNKSTESDTMGTTTGSTSGSTTGSTTGGTTGSTHGTTSGSTSGTTSGTTHSTTSGTTSGTTTGTTSGTTSGSTTSTTSRTTSGTTTGTTTGTTSGTTSGSTSGTTMGTTSGSTSGTTTGTTSGTTTGTTAGTTSGTTGSTTSGTTGGSTTGGMSTSSNMTNMDDDTFMMTAASSNMMEIEAGKMAEEKATSPKVKEFGKRMVEQHTRTSQEMKPLASKMGVTMPTTLMPMHQEMLDELSGKSGAEFDKAYMDIMERAHKMDMAMFEAKSKNAKSQGVRAFADKTLSMLRTHHKQANQTGSTTY